MNPSVHPTLFHYPDGVTAVDTEYLHPGHAAAHIIQHAGRAAFVDVGSNDSVPYLLAALETLGVQREAVDYLFLTHVHLDHAGGAGRLMQALPNACAVVHPRGAPHMIDPAKLIAGSQIVYGEERFQRLYGDIAAIPAERVRSTADHERYSLAGRELELLHTPGHALHHQVIFDKAHACVFSGDTFGISYRELDTANGAFIMPTTTPTQFDPDQLVSSIERIVACEPASVYLMHFSRVTNVPQSAESLKAQIREFVAIAKRHAEAPDRYAVIRAEMWEFWRQLLDQHGCTLSEGALLEILGGDLDLNVQGLIAWLDRQRKA